FTSVVFNYGDVYSAIDAQDRKREVPAFFLMGQATHKYGLELQGTIGMLGIVFQPAALTTLFRVPLIELVDERTDLRAVLGKECEELGLRLLELSDREQRIWLIEKFLLAKVYAHNDYYDAIDRTVNAIVLANGQFQMDELLSKVYMSRRQFERKFRRKVGLSPKYYGRLRRISHVCRVVSTSRRVQWQEITHHNGFYDQAHFIRDFREFIGQSPKQYLKSRPELAHLLQEEEES
ncbi:MAG: helix-turn-helix domain-containing protein, partial [Bacteroidota bacterium]